MIEMCIQNTVADESKQSWFLALLFFQAAVDEFMKTHRDGAKSAGQVPDGPSMDEYKLMLKDTLVSAGKGLPEDKTEGLGLFSLSTYGPSLPRPHKT